MNIVPLLFLNQEQLTAFADHVLLCVHEWCDEWTLSDLHANVDVDVSEVDPQWLLSLQKESVTVYSAGNDQILLCSISPASVVEPLARLILGNPSTDEQRELGAIAHSVTVEAYEDLSFRIGRQASAKKEVATLADVTSGVGREIAKYFYKLCVKINGVDIVFIVSALAVLGADHALDIHVTEAKPLAKVEDVVPSQSVRVSFHLAEAEFALKELEGVSVGDVIRLDKSLSEPISMKIEGYERSLCGYVCTRDRSLKMKISGLD